MIRVAKKSIALALFAACICGNIFAAPIIVPAGTTNNLAVSGGSFYNGVNIGAAGVLNLTNSGASTSAVGLTMNATDRVDALDGTISFDGGNYRVDFGADIGTMIIKDTQTLDTDVRFYRGATIGSVSFANNGGALELTSANTATLATYDVNVDFGAGNYYAAVYVSPSVALNGSFVGVGTLCFDSYGTGGKVRTTVNADVASYMEFHSNINILFNGTLTTPGAFFSGADADVYLAKDAPDAVFDFTYSTGQNKLYAAKDSVFSATVDDAAIGVRKDNRLILTGTKNTISSPHLAIGRIDMNKTAFAQFVGDPLAGTPYTLSTRLQISEGLKINFSDYDIEGEIGISKGGAALTFNNVNIDGSIGATDNFSATPDEAVISEALKKTVLNFAGTSSATGNIDGLKINMAKTPTSLTIGGDVNSALVSRPALKAGALAVGDQSYLEISGTLYNTNSKLGKNVEAVLGDIDNSSLAAQGTLAGGLESNISANNIYGTNIKLGNNSALSIYGNIDNSGRKGPGTIALGINSSLDLDGLVKDTNITLGNNGTLNASGNITNTFAKPGAIKIGAGAVANLNGIVNNLNISAGANSKLYLYDNITGNIASSGYVAFDKAGTFTVQGSAKAKEFYVKGNTKVNFHGKTTGNVFFDNTSTQSASVYFNLVSSAFGGNINMGVGNNTIYAPLAMSGFISKDIDAYIDGDPMGISTINIVGHHNSKGEAIDTVFAKNIFVDKINIQQDGSALFKGDVMADFYLNALGPTANPKLTLVKNLNGNISMDARSQSILSAKTNVWGNITGGTLTTKGIASVWGDVNVASLQLGKGVFTLGGNLTLPSAFTLDAGQTLALASTASTFNFGALTLNKGAILDLGFSHLNASAVNLTLNNGSAIVSGIRNGTTWGQLVANSIDTSAAGANGVSLKVAILNPYDVATEATYTIIKSNDGNLDASAFNIALNRLFLTSFEVTTDGCAAGEICVKAAGNPNTPNADTYANPVFNEDAFFASFKTKPSVMMAQAFNKALQNNSENETINNIFALAQFDDTLGSFNTALTAWAPSGKAPMYYAKASQKETSAALHARADEARTGPVNAVWFSGFYNNTRQSEHNGMAAFNGYTGGGIVGADRYFEDNLLLGIAYAYTDASIVYNQKTEIKGSTGVAYANYDITPSLYLNAGLGYTDANYRDTGTATAEYKGYQLSADLQAGYRLAYDAFELTPTAGIAYNRVHTDAYTDSAAQHVMAASAGAWVLNTGVKAGYNIDGASYIMRPRISAAASYDLSAADMARAAQLPDGGIYVVADNKAPALGLDSGIGFDIGLKKSGIIISADYRNLYKDSYISHTYSANVRIPF